MKTNKADIMRLLKQNHNQGYILQHDLLHEICLTNSGNIAFTGNSWNWETTVVPSSHHDYPVETDTFVKIEDMKTGELPEHLSYEFFISPDEYLNKL